MGMPLYYALPPTGYYITADQWMNTNALVERLNFAYQLTNNKFYNQKFDAAHVLALGLLSQTISPDTPSQPRFTKTGARITTLQSGADMALKVLEETLVGGELSSQTNQLIHKQLDQQIPNTNPNDTLNLLAALVMGSPEFQLR